MKLRKISVTFIVAAIGVGLFSYVGSSLHHGASADFTLSLGTVTDMGNLGQPANVTGRDVGASAVIGGQITWIYGDTLYHPNAGSVLTPADWRSATAGISTLSNPMAVTTPEDSRGVPYQAIPYTADEIAYNVASRDPGNNREALWAGSIIALNNDTGLIYFSKLLVKGSYKYEFQGVGVARIGSNSTVATRGSNLLFPPNEPSYANATVHNGVVYLFNCTTKAPYVNPCTLASVPLAQAENRAAYQFWDGSKWNSDITSAKPVIEGPVAGLSVRWNPRIQKFIAIYMPAFTNKMYYRVADNLQGPWGSQQLLFNALVPGAGGVGDYATYQHTELSPDGSNLYATYFRPGGVDSLGVPGGMRLVKVAITSPPVATVNSGVAGPTSNAGGTAPKSSSGAGGAATTGGSSGGQTVSPITGAPVTNQIQTKAPAPRVTILHTSHTRQSLINAGIAVCFLIGVSGLTIDFVLQYRKKHKDFMHHFPYDPDLGHGFKL